MDQSNHLTQLLPGFESSEGQICRSETGLPARMKSLQARGTARRMQPAAIGLGTLPLFSAYEIKLDEADYSNLVAVYDALPRFSWASKTVRDVSEMTTKIEGTLNNEPFKVILKAVNIERPIKIKGKATGETEWVSVYPGSREECVEEALRKFSTQSGKFNETECSVRFSLYELKKELTVQGHTITYSELREALNILAESNLTIQTRTADGETIDIKSNYLPLLYLRSRNKSSKNYVEAKDMPEEEKSIATQCVAVLHPLISRGIERGDFRLYHYGTSMRLTNGLAKILNRELSLKWRNASPTNPYSFSMVEFLSNTARGLGKRIPEDFRSMNVALQQLIDQKVLTSFQSTPVKKTTGKGAIDYIYQIYPHKEFVGVIVKGHRKVAALREQLVSSGRD
ncbi:replication protein [Pseudomonas sp. NPDC089569]|uniref:replication protein n=1 Tax=Pseudomonas sp. NPDC089569 TaxID=3390722 RepID=UPI003CFBF112